MSRTWLVVVLFSIAPAFGQDFCATSPEHTQQLHEQYLRLRDALPASRLASLAIGTLRYDRGILVVSRDDLIAPFDHPFDLEGRSLVFTPRSGGEFALEDKSLEYDDDRGELVATFSTDDLVGTTPYVERTISAFEFPFGSTRWSKIYISGLQGIFFEQPPRFETAQVYAISAFAAAKPVIAPLLFGNRARGFSRRVEIFVRETSSALTVTWLVSGTRVKDVDIQASLFANGTVRFSYRKTLSSPGGLVGLTTGEEALRRNRTAVFSVTDPSGDATSANVDLLSADLQRLGQTDLLELKLRVRQPIVIATLPLRLSYSFIVNGAIVVSVSISRTNGVSVFVADRSTALRDPAISVDGSTITILISDKTLGASGGRVSFVVTSREIGSNQPGDSVTTSVDLTLGQQPFESDLNTAASTSGPIFETFTAPEFIPEAVADRLLANDIVFDRVNNIAMYQTFLTDIVYFASGYSTGGNPGDDNYVAHRPETGSQYPRSPALLHVNKIGYGYNSNERDSFTLLAHEFAHHWLYEPTIVESGNPASVVLAPESAHPAQYVDSRVAFPVYEPTDTSLMGGGYFTRRDDGSWEVPPALTYYGLTWHELYLMGLASPHEVAPWFYLARTEPALGLSYWPNPGSVVTGERVDVTIDQLTSSMGPRRPQWNGDRREFRGLFVLVDRPEEPATEADVDKVREYRDRLVEQFAVATGNRASIVPSLVWFSADTGFNRTVFFRESAVLRGAKYEWRFGDGQTSNDRNSTHQYAAAGSYDVSLTVSTATGLEETTTRRVNVSDVPAPQPLPRKRVCCR